MNWARHTKIIGGAVSWHRWKRDGEGNRLHIEAVERRMQLATPTLLAGPSGGVRHLMQVGPEAVFLSDYGPNENPFNGSYAYRGLWATDGTPAGTRKVFSGSIVIGEKLELSPLVALNGKVYFFGFTPEHGQELRAYDPVTRTSSLVADLVPGPDVSGASTDYTTLIVEGGRLYFVGGVQGSFDRRLYASDGTAAGIAVVDTAGSRVWGCFSTGAGVSYYSSDGIYLMNGTAQSVRKISGPIVTPTGTVRPQRVAVFANAVWAVANTGAFYSMRLDGASDQVPAFVANGVDIQNETLGVTGGRLYFTMMPNGGYSLKWIDRVGGTINTVYGAGPSRGLYAQSDAFYTVPNTPAIDSGQTAFRLDRATGAVSRFGRASGAIVAVDDDRMAYGCFDSVVIGYREGFSERVVVQGIATSSAGPRARPWVTLNGKILYEVVPSGGGGGPLYSVDVPPPTPTATITIRGYIDSNANGQFEPWEAPVEGRPSDPPIRVELFNQSNGIGGGSSQVYGSVVLGSQSEIVLTRVVPGQYVPQWKAFGDDSRADYKIRLSPSATQPAPFTIAEGQSIVLNVPFLVGPTFVGTVYDDANANRRRDANESGRAGVTVFADLDNDAVFDAGEPFGVSIESGLVGVTARVSSSYTMTTVRIMAVGTSEVFQSAPWVAENVSHSTGVVAVVPFSDIGVSRVPPRGVITGTTLSVGGTGDLPGQFLYVDLDVNGQFDVGEPSAVSDSDGKYQLDYVPFGPQLLRHETPGGWRPLAPARWIRVASDAITTVTSTRIRLGSSGGTSVRGTIYHDTNLNGIRDANEPFRIGPSAAVAQSGSGLSFVNVATSASTTVNIDTLGRFDVALAPGRYRLSTSPMSGKTWGQQPYEFDLGNGQIIDDFDIGLVDPDAGRVIGRMFLDRNMNGQLDNGEPWLEGMAGFQPANSSLSMQVDGTGRFLATSLSTNVFTLPDSWNFMFTYTPGFSRIIELREGSESGVGNIPVVRQMDLASVQFSETYFFDANRNGLFESNEPGSSSSHSSYIDYDDDGRFTYGIDTRISSVGVTTVWLKPDDALTLQVRVDASIQELTTPALQAYSIRAGVAGSSQSLKHFIGWNSYVVPQVWGRVAIDVQADSNGDGINDSSDFGTIGTRQFWVDLDKDGVLDAGEPVSTRLTGGTASFTLPAGEYQVRPILPAGWEQTSPPSGEPIVVIVDNPFGGVARVIQTTQRLRSDDGGVVLGSAFRDVNRDGVFQRNERSRSASVVYADLNGNQVLDFGEPHSIVSTSDGRYRLRRLPAGQYQIRSVPLAGYLATSPTAVQVSIAGAGGSDLQIDFGATNLEVYVNLVLGSFVDVNRNGLRDASEPSQAITCTLLRINADGTETALYDVYLPDVRAVLPGNAYRLIASNLPAGWAPSGPQPMNGYVVDLRSGTIPPVVQLDFGVAPTVIISGRVFSDEDNDGGWSSGDKPVAGDFVFLDLNNDGALATSSEPFVQTDASGRYVLPVSNRAGRVRTVRQFGPTDRPALNRPVAYRPWVNGDMSNVDFYYRGLAYPNVAPPSLSMTELDTDYTPRFVLNFDKPLGSSLAASEVVVRNVVTGDLASFSTTPSNYTAVISLDKPGALAVDGVYEVTIDRGAVTDPLLRANTDPIVARFIFLRGDANGDYCVNFDDLLLLAANYGNTLGSYGRGDFNGNGIVNFDDLLILAGNYNRGRMGVGGGDPGNALSVMPPGRSMPFPRREGRPTMGDPGEVLGVDHLGESVL
jgi:ELWxxDGT repeat protein